MRPSPEVAVTMRAIVRRTCRGRDTARRWRRKTGNNPKTWILNSVRENTAVVVVSREASTVLAIRAALVDRLLGNGGLRANSAVPSELASGIFETARDRG